jgi:hypothetical protein
MFCEGLAAPAGISQNAALFLTTPQITFGLNSFAHNE